LRVSFDIQPLFLLFLIARLLLSHLNLLTDKPARYPI
jgi:hypothetical protein